MTEPLFYAEHLPDAGATFTLMGDEAHHAAASRRLAPGDTLWLFDGRGGLARTTLGQVTKRGYELTLRIEERRTEPPSKPSIHLACALPKGDRQSVLLDMATQLGMTQFTPLVCERGVVKPGAHSPERWRRICLEACKQSRRVYLPELHEPASPVQVMASHHGAWIAHPSGVTAGAMLAGTLPDKLTLLVGPEGGFTEEEVRQAVKQGARAVSLGPAILRIETAAIGLLSVISLGACIAG
jgi:16S rRNA (uracil1498-N3)-methyltransferase